MEKMANCGGSTSEGASNRTQHEYAIGGIPLKFPCKAYPTQMAMMHKIITALNRGENALLESPTGSGKSLALLCSSLAWLHSRNAKIEDELMKTGLQVMQNDASMPCVCDCHSTTGPQSADTSLKTATPLTTTPTLTCIEKIRNPVPPISVPSHLAPPQNVQELTSPSSSSVSTLISNQSISGSTVSSGGIPSTAVLPAMLLPPSSSSSSTSFSSTGSLLSDTCKTSSVATSNTIADSANSCLKTSQVSTSHSCTSMVCSSLVTASDKCANGDCSEQVMTSAEPNVPNSKGCDKTNIKTEVTDNIKGAADESSQAAGDSEKLKTEDEKEKQVTVLDDDQDFKPPKKRFRTPATIATDGPATKKKRKGKQKGVVYEDEGSDVDDSTLAPDQHGRPTWRMEDRNTLTSLDLKPLSSTPAVDSTLTNNMSAKCNSTSVSCLKCGCLQGSKGTQNEAQKINPVKARNARPQIFFGTRTHKQITQITHEMIKTAYSSTPMSILASREHTCIHPKVSKSRNKNDDCKKLRDYDEGVSCSFFHRVQQKLGSQCQLRQQYGYNTAWDIEDLVKLGRRVKACPYFALRGLKDDAEIIFCPYNYLIDPMIREQMLIDVENKVIILDEAHNMEDSAREAASLSLTQVQISAILEEMTELCTCITKNSIPLSMYEVLDCYNKLQALCAAFVRWIERTVNEIPPRGYEQSHGIWNGEDFLPVLERELGLTVGSIPLYENALKTIAEAGKEDKDERERGPPMPSLPTLSISSQSLIKNVLIIVGYLFKENKKYLSDYRIALLKTTTMARPKDPSGWMSKRRRSQGFEKVWTTSLNFWCLNPAVAFSDLTRAHSIVLTSGTLSPMTSFSSELGVQFPIQLEASHVIPEAQTWVRSISHGPSGISLTANYQNSETFQFQDEVGEVVLRVCKTVPYGVLCFFSSYKMLEKLTKRWQDTRMWCKIEEVKCIFSEPRSGHKEDFEEAISSYYRVIANSNPEKSDIGDGETAHNGALFLAVCRGKVSEGLDFADNNARAVITIGIPFPNIKDKQVELKREYNNELCHKRGVLTGSEWYEIQAYRALNQALGRCIRHKNDWGALILIDERYSKGHHYTKGLSKWIRQRLNHQSDFNCSMRQLQTFTENMMVKGDSVNGTDQSALLNSPSVSVSLGVSMNSPDVYARKRLCTVSDQPKTPQVLTSNKPTVSKESTLPGSPNVRDIENTPYTSTPVASCKAAPRDYLGLTIASTPGSTLTAANLETTVNYVGVCDDDSFSTREVPNTVTAPTSSKSDNSIQLHGGHGCPPVPSQTAQSCVCQPSVQAKFCYPGGIKNGQRNPAPLLGVATSISSTDVTTSDSVKQQENDSVIYVEESPRNSQAVDEFQQQLPCDPNSELLAQDGHEQKVNECASEAKASFTSNLNIPRTTSPVLFDTPGEPQSLVTKLSTNLPQTNQAPYLHTEDDADIDDDRTPPISPVRLGVDIESKRCVQTKSKTDGSAVQPKDEQNTTAHVSTLDLSKNSTGKEGAAKSTKLHKDSDTTLGQPRTKRINTRRAKRKSILENTDNVRNTPSKRTVQECDDDFVDKKRTPKKRTTGATNEPHNVTTKIHCSCGEVLSEKSDTLEKVELKEALSSKYGHLSTSDVQSSKLWTHLKKTKSRAKTLPVVIVAMSEIDCDAKQEDGMYNAVWDDKILLCYDLLQCQCSKVIGVSIHSTSGDENMQSLVGKVILPEHAVKTYNSLL